MRYWRSMLAMGTVLVASVSLSEAQAQTCDRIQLATVFIFVWQQADGSQGASCDISGGFVHCNFGNPTHQWYVDALTSEYGRSNVQNMIAVLTRGMNDSDAYDRIVLPCYSYEDRGSIISAVKHTIGCYPPVRGGSFIGYGNKPTWNEPERVGIVTCDTP